MPAYDELQDAVAEATTGIHAERVLELGVGTGQTSKRVLDLHPEAELVGIDESAGKTDLFARVAERLRPGGRFVLGDVVLPDDPADAVTPIDGVYDQPSTVDDQVRWLAAVGLQAEVVWARQDLAVIIADSPP